MRQTPLILVVDDNDDNIAILEARLAAQGYETTTAVDGEAAIDAARAHLPDAILLDVMMPKLDGFEVCRRLKADESLPFIQIILVTAKTTTADVVAGLDAGADDYLTKPVDQAALIARLRANLRVKALQDQVREQASTLERRVAEQVAKIENMGRLRRFLSPQIAEAIVASGDKTILDHHRRDITVVFCDLRGFTSFSESAEPEDVMGVLHQYHVALGPLIHQYEGTLERFLGDGLMVIFNDPVPCPDPAVRAVRMAVAMREQVNELAKAWRRRGFDLGFGVGVATGYATLGRIGFEGRYDYAAIGGVSNLGARLCDEALHGQILISQRVVPAVEDIAELEPLGELELKGFNRPVATYNVVQLTD